MKRIPSLAISLIFVSLFTACGVPAATFLAEGPGKTVSLNVFAAASLTEAFTQIGRQFEVQHPGLEVVFNFAGSQQLVQQLSDGAPADVFASANQLQMAEAVQGGRVAADAAQVFVTNHLVVIVPVRNPAGLAELVDLARPGLKLILAAQEVPVGRYTLDLLDTIAKDPAYGSAFKEAVLENVVSYEHNVKSIVTKIILDEADAGIVYTSDLSGENVEGVGQITIPESWNVKAAYPLAVIQDSHNPSMAQAFVAYVLSAQGQEVLAQFGFIPAGK